jgi:hypothetical protein
MSDMNGTSQYNSNAAVNVLATRGLASAPSTGSLPMFIASSGAEGVSYTV